MPGDSLNKKIDTTQYQLQSKDTIIGKEPIVLLNYLKKDEDRKVFSLPVDVIFTSIIVPLVAFFLGLLIVRIREKWKEINTAKAHQGYFLTWVDLIRDRVKKQSEAIKEFATEMLDINANPHYKTFNFHIDKLKEISPVELYKALVLLKKGNKEEQKELYYKALNSLDFFQRKYSESLDFVSKFHEQESQMNKEWSLGLQELNNLRLAYITSKERNLTGDYFLIGFYEIHKEMIKKTETKSNLFYHYIVPIEELCNKFLNATPGDKRVLDVEKINSILFNSFTIMEKSRIRNSSLFIERHQQLEKSLKELEDACAMIKILKFKSAII